MSTELTAAPAFAFDDRQVVVACAVPVTQIEVRNDARAEVEFFDDPRGNPICKCILLDNLYTRQVKYAADVEDFLARAHRHFKKNEKELVANLTHPEQISLRLNQPSFKFFSASEVIPDREAPIQSPVSSTIKRAAGLSCHRRQSQASTKMSNSPDDLGEKRDSMVRTG
jgi:hypothetical protein